jgi:hypothetical protein
VESSHRGLRRVASFRPYKSKQVGDTGPVESARRSNSRALGSPFSGLTGHVVWRAGLGWSGKRLPLLSPWSQAERVSTEYNKKYYVTSKEPVSLSLLRKREGGNLCFFCEANLNSVKLFVDPKTNDSKPAGASNSFLLSVSLDSTS